MKLVLTRSGPQPSRLKGSAFQTNKKAAGCGNTARQSIGLWDKDMSRALQDPLDKLYPDDNPFVRLCKERERTTFVEGRILFQEAAMRVLCDTIRDDCYPPAPIEWE